jgi:hypothetical protein
MHNGAAIAIRRLGPADRASWERLFRAYIDFYERSLDDAEYECARRLYDQVAAERGFVVCQIML